MTSLALALSASLALAAAICARQARCIRRLLGQREDILTGVDRQAAELHRALADNDDLTASELQLRADVFELTAENIVIRQENDVLRDENRRHLALEVEGSEAS